MDFFQAVVNGVDTPPSEGDKSKGVAELKFEDDEDGLFPKVEPAPTIY